MEYKNKITSGYELKELKMKGYDNGYYCSPLKHIDYKFFGHAIVRCWEDKNGKLWVDNREYGTQVNFCPFTGKEALIKI